MRKLSITSTPLKAYVGKGVRFPEITAANAGRYSYTVRFVAAMNPARATSLTP